MIGETAQSGRTTGQSGVAKRALTAPVMLAVIMVAMTMAVSFDLGGLRLTPIRCVLLLFFVPLLIRFLSGRAGRIVAADIFLMLFCGWMMISLLVNEGIGKFAFSAISAIEVFGGYLIGRCLIRSAADFRYLFILHMLVLAVMFPFALVELLTGRQVWAELLAPLGDTTVRGASSRPRWGMDRVLAGFEHPILFGLFCSVAAANVFYIWRDKILKSYGYLTFVVAITFMSLSSGPLLSVVVQAQLSLWDMITRGKWKLLAILSAIGYVVIDALSNRTPLIIFIETFTFSSGTAWTRVIQWTYGSAEVMRNPIFGKGLDGNWLRPSWLYTSSIDNYWLVIAFRHGLPGIALLLAAFLVLLLAVIRTKGLSERDARYRTGYCIALVGIAFTLATVHIWGAVSIFVYLYLGAGAWFFLVAPHDGSGSGELAPAPDAPAPRYSRFAPALPSPGTAAGAGGQRPVSATSRPARTAQR